MRSEGVVRQALMGDYEMAQSRHHTFHLTERHTGVYIYIYAFVDFSVARGSTFTLCRVLLLCHPLPDRHSQPAQPKSTRTKDDLVEAVADYVGGVHSLKPAYQSTPVNEYI